MVWAALLAAPALAGRTGLPGILLNLTAALNHPFVIEWCEGSFKTVLLFALAYGMGVGIYFSLRKNYRRREEHGSAKWGDAGSINKRYSDRSYCDNKIR